MKRLAEEYFSADNDSMLDDETVLEEWQSACLAERSAQVVCKRSCSEQPWQSTQVEGMAGTSDSLKALCKPYIMPLKGSHKSTEEASAFLDQLARCVSGAFSAGADLPVHAWESLAELNIALNAHFHLLPSSALKGYHSLTRAPRHNLWGRFVLSMVGPQAGENFGRGWGPLHAQMLLVLLERVLTSYAEAQLVRHTFALPTWLLGWAQKWGYPRANISVLALHAFAPGADCHQQPVRIIYIPCFDL